MNQKLSVVVPVFNCEAYLRECIESILNQIYENIELILVDDGSTDLSGEICDEYEKKDKRVVVIHTENDGPIKARFRGVERANSDYIAFADADDWIASDTYEQMIKRIGCHDMIISGIYRYHSQDDVRVDIPMLDEGVYDREAIEKRIIPYMLWSIKRDGWELDPSLWSKIFKKDLLIDSMRKISEFNFYFGDDTAVIFPLMLKVDSVVIIHNCYYFHRQRKKNIIPPYFQDEYFFEKLFSLYEYLKAEFRKSDYWDVLNNQLEHFYMNAVQLKQQSFSDYAEKKEDIFPFWEILRDAKVVLYGAGVTGKRYYNQNEQYHFCNILLWVDRNYKKLKSEGEKIVSPELIHTITFDYLVIAVQSAGLAQQIKEMLLEMGIPEEKIVWSGAVIRKIMMSGAKKQ